jgi:hypothetical protein
MDPHQIERKDPDPCPHPHLSCKLDPDPDPDPHQRDNLDPDPQQFADDKPKCMECDPI